MGPPFQNDNFPRLFQADVTAPNPTQTNHDNHTPVRSNEGLGSVSVVVPVLNEADNLAELTRQIVSAIEPTGRFFELILVDDGSTDNSHELLRHLVENSSDAQPIQAILLAGNFGQTAALKAGIDAAVCDHVVTLDGDLQNDPADIPAMLDQLDAGFEIVLGWRKRRQDHLWSRKIPSKIANLLIRHVTRTQVRDLGCGLKAMTRDLAQRLELVGDMHRFIAVLASHLKAKSCEVPTNHRPRVHGQTKYGLGRVKRVILDLFVLSALQHRASPMRFFGGWALQLASWAAVSLSWIAVATWIQGPQWYLGVVAGLDFLMGLGALQLASTGLLAEIMLRQKSSAEVAGNSNSSYRVREVLNHTASDDANRRAA